MNSEKTGKLIRTIRTQKDMTQKELAEIIQVSNAAVSKWENGHGFPDISLLEPLADALDISIVELINGELNTASPKSEENSIIKEIIHLSEFERKHHNAKHSIITGLLILFVLFSGYGGIVYLWIHQNEPLLLPNGFLNLSAILFGLLAWILAIINIFRSKKSDCYHFCFLSTLSFLCCAIAIWIPILTMDLLVRNHDTSAVQDIVWGYNFASIFLLMVTVILNILAFYIFKHKK